MTEDQKKIMDLLENLGNEVGRVQRERHEARAERDEALDKAAAAKAEAADWQAYGVGMLTQHRKQIAEIELLKAEAARCREMADNFSIHCQPACDKADALEAELAAAKAEAARMGEALEKIFIGGNHLASALIGLLGASALPYNTEASEALREIGGGNVYDIWVAWSTMMQVRDSLAAKPALDWLAAQRREAVAEWLEKAAREECGGYYERSVEGMLEDAAALRAGEVTK